MIPVKWMTEQHDDFVYLESPVKHISSVPRIGDMVTMDGLDPEDDGAFWLVEDVMWTYRETWGVADEKVTVVVVRR